MMELEIPGRDTDGQKHSDSARSSVLGDVVPNDDECEHVDDIEELKGSALCADEAADASKSVNNDAGRAQQGGSLLQPPAPRAEARSQSPSRFGICARPPLPSLAEVAESPSSRAPSRQTQ